MMLPGYSYLGISKAASRYYQAGLFRPFQAVPGRKFQEGRAVPGGRIQAGRQFKVKVQGPGGSAPGLQSRTPGSSRTLTLQVGGRMLQKQEGPAGDPWWLQEEAPGASRWPKEVPGGPTRLQEASEEKYPEGYGEAPIQETAGNSKMLQEAPGQETPGGSGRPRDPGGSQRPEEAPGDPSQPSGCFRRLQKEI
jgi:hypothetical protein